jgi:penicillin-binding protein 1C
VTANSAVARGLARGGAGLRIWLVAGLRLWLVAGLRLWLVAGFGLLAILIAGAGFTAWSLANLSPLDLTHAQSRSTIVVDRKGELLRAFTTPDDRWRLPVAGADVDQRYLKLLRAYEDRRFDHHIGVDARAVLRAAWQSLRHGRIVSGGSTLTMQVARLIEPRSERSLAAKFRQALRAVDLESRFSKIEILNIYLALAPFGGNLEGVRAASLAYFGKEPRRLTAGEAALLVALPQAPEARRPDRSAEAARRARDRVLVRAEAAGVLSPSEVEAARAEHVSDLRRPFPAIAAHAAEAAVAERPALAVHHLTLDRELQRALETLASERATTLGPKLAVAVVVVEHATGRVIASVGGGRYLDTERAGALDLTKAIRSPGSTLKPFIYAMAFEEGLAHPETVLEDRPSRYGAYTPENFDLGFQGTLTARRALQQSLNVPAVDLLSALGPTRFLTRLRGTGAGLIVPGESQIGLAVGLGGLGMTLTDLAGLYAGLARGGEVLPLSLHADVYSLPESQRRLTDPVSAWYVADILKDAPPPPNASSGRFAFKTGTSYGYRDAWAVGFDRKHVVAVWTGRPDGAPVAGLVGRTAAAPILFDAFARLGVDPEPFVRPSGALVASTASLPPPLRHRRDDVPKTVLLARAPLSIAFPPEGAHLDLSDGPGSSVQLRANGGVPPFIWLVNGRPVASPELRRQSIWVPEGAGFVQISVIDANGLGSNVNVRLIVSH